MYKLFSPSFHNLKCNYKQIKATPFLMNGYSCNVWPVAVVEKE